jgi:hypothetical protein
MSAGPGVSMAVYLTITLLYFIVKMVVQSADGIGLTISYFCLVILGQFFINADITKTTCGETNFGVAMLASTVPWILVLGSITTLLKVFPGWLIPFSNTIGYAVSSAAGIGKLFNEILVPQMENTAGTEDTSDEGKHAALKTLESIYNDRSLLVNEISRENLPAFWKNMKKANIIQKDAGDVNSSLYDADLDAANFEGKSYENFTKLFGFIRMKDLVSEFIWYALTGTLVCSMSYSYIQNVGCFRSVEEMKKTHDDYLKQEKDIADKKKEKEDDTGKTVYKTYE